MSQVQDLDLNATHLRKLKVAELREECTSRQLETEGTKQVLTDRLMEWRVKQQEKEKETQKEESRDEQPASTAAAAATTTDDSAMTDTNMNTSDVKPTARSNDTTMQDLTTATTASTAPAPSSSLPTPEAAPRRILKLARSVAPAASTSSLAVSLPPTPSAAASSSSTPIVAISNTNVLTPITTSPQPTLGRRTSGTTASATASSFSSASLRVEGFKRPITNAQIESLLKQYGETRAISIPFVKNLALVTYESTESASAAQSAINGCVCAIDGHQEILNARFVADSAVEDALRSSRAPVSKTPAALAAASAASSLSLRPDPRAAAQRAAEETRKQREATQARRREVEQQERETSERLAAAAVTTPIIISTSGRRVITIKSKKDRENGDGAFGGGGGMRIEKNYDEAGLDGNSSSLMLLNGDLAEDEPPTLQLDELFRKTSFAPPIYWIPATKEEREKRNEVRRREKEREEEKENRLRRDGNRASRERHFGRASSRSRSRPRSPASRNRR